MTAHWTKSRTHTSLTCEEEDGNSAIAVMLTLAVIALLTTISWH